MIKLIEEVEEGIVEEEEVEVVATIVAAIVESELVEIVFGSRSLESSREQVFFLFEISCDESQRRIAQCKERFRLNVRIARICRKSRSLVTN